MNTVKSIFFGWIFLSAVGCDGSEFVDEPKTCIQNPVGEELQPFEVGNTWTYDAVDHLGELKNTNVYKVISAFESNPVTRGPAFVVRYYQVDRPDKVIDRAWAYSEKGLSLVGRKVDSTWHYAEYEQYLYPATVGESTMHHMYGGVGPDGSVLLNPTSEIVYYSDTLVAKTPIGSYTVVTYKHESYTLVDAGVGPGYYQYRPGVGLLAIDIRRLQSEGENPSSRWQLVSYCLMQ